MPAKPQALRKRKSAKAPGLPAEYREYLLTGYGMGLGEIDTGEAAKYWEQYGRALTKYWLVSPDDWQRGSLSVWDGFVTPAGPCHRPAGWWRFSSLPEPRRHLDAETILRREAELLGRQSDGERLKRWNTFYSKLVIFESDYEFLSRCNLLTKMERDWLAQFPKVSADDWALIFHKDWATGHARAEHVRRNWRCLTAKGRALERQVRAYWQRLGLSVVLPKSYNENLYNIDD